MLESTENNAVTKEKPTRTSNLTPRQYFVMLDDAILVNDLSSEVDCKLWIIDNGENDVPYHIGYSVTMITPITKTAKITLK